MTSKRRADERRRHPRSRGGFSTVEGRGELGGLNHVDNISASGVLCHTAQPIPLMTKMSIALDLPKPVNQRVECEGIVVRCDPEDQSGETFKVAILYTDVSEDGRKAIEEFVTNDLAQSASPNP